MAGDWERFQRAFTEDAAMQRQLEESLRGVADDATVDKLVEFARSRGYAIDAEDAVSHFERILGKSLSEELTDEELERVSGGANPTSARIVPSQMKVLLLSP